VPKPDVKGRLEILKVHTRTTPLGEDVNLEIIARSTPGFAGLSLQTLLMKLPFLLQGKTKKR